MAALLGIVLIQSLKRGAIFGPPPSPLPVELNIVWMDINGRNVHVDFNSLMGTNIIYSSGCQFIDIFLF
jgi:hypothetical protein